jgi:hypothetical protein
MSFTVKRTNGTNLVDVADQTIDTTASSLNLVGRGAVNYAQSFAENFIHLAENFANSSAPSNPLVGQQWWDSSQKVMKAFDGTNWTVLGGGLGDGGTGNLPGGTTIGGTVQTGSRLGGATGLVLQYGSGSTTVAALFSEGKIIAIACMETIPNDHLPATVAVQGTNYVVAARFPNGIRAGFTIATDAAGYVMAGLATSAQYADLAERYAASEPLEAGDLVELGGLAEIQKARGLCTAEVFGVISTAPGLKLNDAAGDDATHPFVALTGRVPVKVIGKVRKGQRLVSSEIPGVAIAAPSGAATEAVFGRALASKTDAGIGLVEVVVGGVK